MMGRSSRFANLKISRNPDEEISLRQLCDDAGVNFYQGCFDKHAVAAILGREVKTVENWSARNSNPYLKAYKSPEGHIFWTKEDLIRYVNSCVVHNIPFGLVKCKSNLSSGSNARKQ